MSHINCSFQISLDYPRPIFRVMVVYPVIRCSKVAFAKNIPAEKTNWVPRDAEDEPQLRNHPQQYPGGTNIKLTVVYAFRQRTN